ncbi:MAG: hypothetical protein GX600_09095 [Dehalococcoidia bacterium]|nr:hypothetical protein [Dehalococcoidia bacterium]
MASTEETPQVEAPKPSFNARVKRWLQRLAWRTFAIVLLVIGIVVAAAFLGVEPLATYKEMVHQRIVALGQAVGLEPSVTYPRQQLFKGTYRTEVPVLEMQQTITFEGDTLTVVDSYAGTVIYSYTATMISAEEGALLLEDVGTQQLTEVPLHYVADADCLILYPQGRQREGVTYCR